MGCWSAPKWVTLSDNWMNGPVVVVTHCFTQYSKYPTNCVNFAEARLPDPCCWQIFTNVWFTANKACCLFLSIKKVKINWICTVLELSRWTFVFSCPPRTFLPALCNIFLDETAPDNVLEVTARAITYYLDVSAECTRRIVAVEGAVKALCNRLVVADMKSRTSKDLAEQCIKVRKWLI